MRRKKKACERGTHTRQKRGLKEMGAYVIPSDVRMILFQAVVQDGDYRPFSGHAFGPSFLYVHVKAHSSVLHIQQQQQQLSLAEKIENAHASSHNPKANNNRRGERRERKNLKVNTSGTSGKGWRWEKASLVESITIPPLTCTALPRYCTILDSTLLSTIQHGTQKGRRRRRLLARLFLLIFAAFQPASSKWFNQPGEGTHARAQFPRTL